MFMPYHTINGFEAHCNEQSANLVVVDVRDIKKSINYEATIMDGRVTFVDREIYRGSGRHFRTVGYGARFDEIKAIAAAAYARHQKIGKEPVINDYIEEGVRIVSIEADGSYLTTYDEPEERVVYIGGGAICWDAR